MSGSIRIAEPADTDAVAALLVASYSSLLAAHYDRDTLKRDIFRLTDIRHERRSYGIRSV